MDLTLTEDEALIERTFEKFLAAESGPARVRAAEPLGFDPALWEQAVETRAPTMGVPESLGGSGASAMALVLVAQQAGRHLAPIPLVESMTASNLLARVGAGELLNEINDGAIATLAVRPSVSGRCRLVPAGAIADIVVIADGDELVALKRNAPSRPPQAQAVPNLACSPIADVDLKDAAFKRIKLASGAEARGLFADALAEWTLLTTAALDGLRAAAIELAVKHVLERKAFGVTIASFQAIQHRLADLYAAGEGARLLVQRAAWQRQEGMEGAANLGAMAFLFLSELAFKTCRESLQFHGGYGYTLDFDIQLYIRRAKAWPLVAGELRAEYQRLAAELYPEEA
jgi:alkylation response protein AidB-like acyl-CoA dehydrogenase